MTLHLQKELEKIKRRILWLGAKVEEQLRMAINAVNTRDRELATKIIESDEEIDKAEVEIEEECLKVIALNQPVAIDLRFITAVIKINSSLERIGDQAVNIAERVLGLSDTFKKQHIIDFSQMETRVREMLQLALNSLVKMDSDLAHKVWMMDDDVDEENRRVYDITRKTLRDNPENVDELLSSLLVARHLERIADLATNIAEDVIYMVGGEIVRHQIYSYAYQTS